MNRVQVLLYPETHQKIKNLARKKKISTSKFIREAAEEKLNQEYPVTKKKTIDVLREAGKNAFKGGPKDLSSNDDYLYKI